jgi:hypothetical protein
METEVKVLDADPAPSHRRLSSARIREPQVTILPRT